ncbi:hypothetical protein [Pedobacter sp. JCM 36344]|uniref:hypothetical protein n=1 Tax=Pedobacter sp. JCM 36344 TaxID=3374280 RepID=UPI00397C1A33
MKTHTTSTLKTLIVEKMNPNYKMTVQEIETWTKVLPDIKKELEEQINFFIQSIFHKSLVKKQLQQMQTECTYLLNAIDKYTDLSDEMLALKILAIHCVEYTLLTIINDYGPYADLSLRMNQIHFRLRIDIIKADLIKIKEKLKEQAVEPELQVIVLQGAQELIGKKTGTYERLNYLGDLQLNLLIVLSHTSATNVRESLRSFLYQVHYNTEQFIEFLKKEYRADMGRIKDLHDQLSFLVRVHGHLRKVQPTPKKPKYLRQDTAIYDRLIAFFDTEMVCLKIAIKKAMPIVVPIAAPIPVPQALVDYKLRFNFSVDCLAYLIKLMVNANIIEPGIKAELLRYVAANFQTPGTKVGGMSPGSFLTKYKNVTQSTSVTVKAGLMAMLKLVDKEF